MITDGYSEREQFYHIVKRLKEERTLSWREAWKLVAEIDKAVNSRSLFPTFLTFERFHVRYKKATVVKNIESGLKTEEMHEFYSISEGAYIQELLITTGVHVNQLDSAGRSWLDIEEEQREKRIKRLLEEYEEGTRVGKDPARKRTRTGALRKRISKGNARARSAQNATDKNRHERTGPAA
ncbi:MAG TPA: hypothetical protein VFJ29_05180 [Candidatus Kapabacteria bacterium]|nr:hypothetical protein [Candidatus Kapabacteria bacterium]